jgi:hypothetical protein
MTSILTTGFGAPDSCLYEKDGHGCHSNERSWSWLHEGNL